MGVFDVLTANGFQNSDSIVYAARDTGLPLGVAVALIEKESRGANIYGHDRGSILAGEQVTYENFTGVFLPHVLAGGISNGVGPCQITYPGYFKQNPGYPYWMPYDNMVFGFKLMLEYCNGDYSYNSLVRAGSTYNSGRPDGAPEYGQSFASLAGYWTGTLAPHEEGSQAAPAGPAPVASVAPPADAGVYIVQPGDTLSGIAARYGTTWQALAAANGITNPDLIYPGQAVTINVGGGARATYTVVAGDTLSDIAARYGTSWQALAAANGITNPDLIYPGQVLTI